MICVNHREKKAFFSLHLTKRTLTLASVFSRKQHDTFIPGIKCLYSSYKYLVSSDSVACLFSRAMPCTLLAVDPGLETAKVSATLKNMHQLTKGVKE